MKKYLIGFIFVILNCANALEFQQDNKKLDIINLSEIRSGAVKLKSKLLKSIELKVYNIVDYRDATYEGYKLFDLLDSIYTPRWRSQKKITFVANDGYRQTVKIKEMIKHSKSRLALLAYKEKGQNFFKKIKKGKRVIDPGPLYLVWSNMSKKEKKKLYKYLKWPYQLNVINIWSAN